jgi:hypothetical protein
MFTLFQNIKYRVTEITVSAGLYCVNVYANVYVFLRKTTKKWYDQHKIIKKYTDDVMDIAHSLIHRFITYRIEPFYDLWFCMVYSVSENYIEDYVNLNNNSELISFPLLNSVFQFPTLNTNDIQSDIEKNITELFTGVCRTIHLKKYDFYDINNDFLILFKIADKYISRIGIYNRFRNESVKNISLNTVFAPILCVEYSHPQMEERIFLNIDKGFFIENNEILSPMFVERCLSYQSHPYEFDLNYKLHITDKMLKHVTMDRTSYMEIVKNGYQIKSI